ncbi:MAG: KdsC family phosphatase [Pseudobdellovibrionaceae bacterium]
MRKPESSSLINPEKIKNIKMLILDVDGILTNCQIWYDSSGEWRRTFSIRDGVGIKQLIESGYQLGIITGSKSQDIRARAEVLGFQHFYEGALNKIPAYEQIKDKTKLDDSEIAYMGDDFFDIPLLDKVGFAATVPDAMEQVFPHVHYITKRPAGNGAVREVCDFIAQFGALAEHQGDMKGPK